MKGLLMTNLDRVVPPPWLSMADACSQFDHETLINPYDAERRQYEPGHDNYRARHPAHRLSILYRLLCPGSALKQHGTRNQSDSQRDAKLNDVTFISHQVVGSSGDFVEDL